MAEAATHWNESVEDDGVHTGLQAEYRAEMAALLSDILATSYKLTIKNHLYHWNVVGPIFKPIHELTEDNYKALFAATDVTAERIRALGHLAPDSLATVSDFTFPGADIGSLRPGEMINDLIVDHETAVRGMRDAAVRADEAGDLVTADMLTEQLAFNEKALWMLRATSAHVG